MYLQLVMFTSGLEPKGDEGVLSVVYTTGRIMKYLRLILNLMGLEAEFFVLSTKGVVNEECTFNILGTKAQFHLDIEQEIVLMRFSGIISDDNGVEIKPAV